MRQLDPLHSGARSSRRHILTIAMEDYFHAPSFRGLIDKKHWGRFESRYEASCLSALERLDAASSTATFFVNSWVAQDRPDLLREVVRRGHEVALSGDSHPSFRNLRPAELREHLKEARGALEEACGRRVLGYRRSDVRLTARDLWALQVLAEEGFLYDSSLSPTLWAFRKQPWRRFIHREHAGTRFIEEVPLSSLSVCSLMVPFAGGNYFRQYPGSVIRWAIENWERTTSHPMVLYFRLWDLDPSHPKILTGSMVRNVRHYRNGRGMLRTLDDMFQRYSFRSIASHLNLVQERAAPLPVASPLAHVTTQLRHRTPVSVIVPCYNEDSSIFYLGKCLEELAAELEDLYDLQYILVDDGSSDRTWERLQEQFSSRSEFLLKRHAKNQGVTAAICTGIQNSHEVACSIDCDCTYDPRELKAMLALLSEDIDLVTASPYHPQGKVANVPGWRLALSRGASRLYRIATGCHMHTFTACFRVYRRSSFLATPLKFTGFLGVAELAGRFALDGRRIVEHPATLNSRLFGYSKLKVARTIAGHLKLLASLALSRIGIGHGSVRPKPHGHTPQAVSSAARKHL